MTRRTSATCAYCRELADGREDWFPRWLGRHKGMQLLVDRICDACNQSLGKSLDQPMSRESPQAVNRALMQTPGRHGKSPHLFSHKSQQAQPPVVLNVAAPGAEFQPHAEIIPGSNPPRSQIVRQLIFEKPDGTRGSIRISHISPKEDEKWLRRAIENYGFESARLVEMYCEPDDPSKAVDQRKPVAWLRRALLAAFPQSAIQAQEHGIQVNWLVDGEVEALNVAATLRVEVNIDYARALAKTAFHYALTVDRTITGREDEFQGIRRFIKDGIGPPSDFVDANARPFLIDSGTARRGVHHFLLVEVNRVDELVVRMQYFVPGSRISGAQDVLGISPVRVVLGLYPHLSAPRLGHAIRLFEKKVDGFDGEILPLELGQVDGLWGVFPPPWAGRKPSM